MARKALLVGTSEYLDGFKPLESPLHDVRALADLLKNQEIGGFDDVQILTNSESSKLGQAIETWYLGHAKHDFVLLFIAGHGVKDSDLKLHFVAKDTKKVGERLITTTAIAASSVSAWMRKSKAEGQIVVLNCCFSGAFGNLVPMDDGTIDFEEVIAVEGRVVMTSTSSTAYAFENSGRSLSVYGYYLVEAMRTGAAAAPDSDHITIGELHKYVGRKVQEETPSMVPKIFAKGEGYQLRIAKVAVGDPEVQYRKHVESYIEEEEGEIDEILVRPLLQEHQKKLGLDLSAAERIESDVLEPIRQYRRNLGRYQQYLEAVFQHKNPYGVRETRLLKQFQSMLGLLDTDISKAWKKSIEKFSQPLQKIVQEVEQFNKSSNEPINEFEKMEQSLGVALRVVPFEAAQIYLSDDNPLNTDPIFITDSKALSVLWQKILIEIDLKSTQGILAASCYLLEIDGNALKVAVRTQGMLPTVKTKVQSLGKAATKAFRRSVKIALVVVEDSKSNR
jgi:hypothetical protein